MDCARHDMKRPNGVGDLQKGERCENFVFILILQLIILTKYRYINMDYFFYSSLASTTILLIVASYDIACQWSHNFRHRMSASFPESWAINSLAASIRFLIPKFHLPAHIPKCHQDYSFNYTKGVGRTDREAPESGWANLNDLAYSTQEMGPRSQQDTIEDHLGDRNWTKIVGMGNMAVHVCSFNWH